MSAWSTAIVAEALAAFGVGFFVAQVRGAINIAQTGGVAIDVAVAVGTPVIKYVVTRWPTGPNTMTMAC